jgi:hypothetical protein
MRLRSAVPTRCWGPAMWEVCSLIQASGKERSQGVEAKTKADVEEAGGEKVAKEEKNERRNESVKTHVVCGSPNRKVPSTAHATLTPTVTPSFPAVSRCCHTVIVVQTARAVLGTPLRWRSRSGALKPKVLYENLHFGDRHARLCTLGKISELCMLQSLSIG